MLRACFGYECPTCCFSSFSPQLCLSETLGVSLWKAEVFHLMDLPTVPWQVENPVGDHRCLPHLHGWGYWREECVPASFQKLGFAPTCPEASGFRGSPGLHRLVVALAVLASWLDSIILEGFSSLNDSMISLFMTLHQSILGCVLGFPLDMQIQTVLSEPWWVFRAVHGVAGRAVKLLGFWFLGF